MYAFKSQNTYNKLYPIAPLDPEFQLDSMVKIDEKFRTLCHEYSRKELSFQNVQSPIQEEPSKFKCLSNEGINEKSRRKKFKSNSNIYQKKVQFKEQEQEEEPLDNEKKGQNLSDDEKLWALLEEKIKKNLKKKDKENPLVKYFKNPLIAAVIESLVVKTIESTFKIKLNLDGNSEDLVPANLMKLFNISPIALSTMASKQEKLQFVIRCMVKNIDEALDHLSHARDIQEKKMTEFDQKYIQEKKITEKDQIDIFEWLQIKTKYHFLKKKLRSSVLEKLNHFENQRLVNEALNSNLLSRNNIRSPSDHSKNFLQKITLLKIPQLSTETILKDMNSEFKLITRRAHYNKNPSNKSAIKEDLMISLDPVPNYEWDGYKENCFRTSRKSAKNLYNEEVKCSNFLSVAFLPLVQETYLEEKKKKDRNIKLVKYAEGEWLSSEELKFLADTNALLNKCVDKKFLQDAVNIIDPEVIDNLELLLAENIIMNYENLRNTIKKARLQYMQEFTDYKYEKIQQKAEEAKKKEELLRKNKENKKFRKTLENICLKMQRQGKFFSKNKEKKHIFAKMFIQKLKTNISKKNSEKNIGDLKKENLIKNFPQTPNQKRLELKRRKYHPSSKLFLKENVDNKSDEEIPEEEVMKNQFNNNEIIKFNLMINGPIHYKEPNNFKKFYSGGPLPPTRSEPFWSPYDPKKPIVVNSPAELKKIITLQKFIRKYLAKLKVKSLKEEPSKELKESLKRFKRSKVEMKFCNNVKNFIDLTKNPSKPTLGPQIYTPQIMTNTTPHFFSSKIPLSISQVFQKHPNKLSSITTSITRSTKNFSTQNSQFSQENAKKIVSNNETPSQTPGLLKHRKLIEHAKFYSLASLKALGFAYTKGDVNCKDESNNTALFYAAERGLYDFCEFLVRLGADCNESCSEKNTALHMAFKSGKIPIITLLLKHGGDLNIRNKFGNPPKKMACGKVLKELDLKMMVSFIG